MCSILEGVLFTRSHNGDSFFHKVTYEIGPRRQIRPYLVVTRLLSVPEIETVLR